MSTASVTFGIRSDSFLTLQYTEFEVLETVTLASRPRATANYVLESQFLGLKSQFLGVL